LGAQDGPAGSRATSVSERRASLDVLRGVAIALVVAYHACLELNVGGEPGEPTWLGALSSHRYGYFFPHHAGDFGVKLFFALSGFCIHAASEARLSTSGDRRTRAHFADFARRRFARIVPPYALALLAFAAVSPLAGDGGGGARLADLAVHAGFAHTLVPGHLNHLNPSFWSLAVEVQLYALYPIFRLAAGRRGLARLAIACAVGSLAWRLGVPSLTRETWVVNLPWRWGGEWFLGVAAAELVAASKRLPRGSSLTALALGTALLLPSRSALAYALVPPVVVGVVVAEAATSTGLARLRPFAALGGVSYGLYLVHQPIFTVTARGLLGAGIAPTSPLGFSLGLASASVASLVLAVGLERMGRRMQGWLLRSA
jgi:peptidoglycan/LPS O-acetylase OafA/YrhL